jgi:RNA polymerase sigma factor (sigma-70 family)
MRSVNFSDPELIKGLVSRDERIVKEFYLSYFQTVRRFVLVNKGNEEDARDLFQDVLLVLFQKFRDGSLHLTCSLKTYLYSISRLLWLKELGKRKWISCEPIDHEAFEDVDGDILQVHEKNERLMLFRKCFEKLSEACRRVLSLSTEGISMAEITRIMGYRSEQYTKNRRYRCKSSLINSIRSEYDYIVVKYGNNTHH